MWIKKSLLLAAAVLIVAPSDARAQDVEVEWIQTDVGRGAADDTNDISLSIGLGRPIAVVGSNRNLGLSFISLIDPDGDRITAQTGQGSYDLFGTNVDTYAWGGPTVSRDYRGGRDWLVTTSTRAEFLERPTTFFDVRSKDVSERDWTLVERVRPEPSNVQILAVTGLELLADRFFIGGGIDVPGSGSPVYDGFVAAYDLSGDQKWSDRFSAYFINITDMQVSGDRLYVTGHIRGVLPEAGSPLGGTDGFIRVYRLAPSPDDRPVHLWTRRFATGWGNDQAWLLRIAIDPDMNAYVTGSTDGLIPGRLSGDAEFDPDGSWRSAFVVKYDADGERMWTKQLGARGPTGAHTIAVDCRGAIWVGGWAVWGFRTEDRPDNQNRGSSIVRLHADGRVAWASSSVLTDSLEARFGHHIYDMRLNESGFLIVAGIATVSDDPRAENWDTFVAKLNDRMPHGNWARFGGCFLRCPKVETPRLIENCSSVGEFSPDRATPCLCDPIPMADGVPHEGFPGDATCLDNVDNDNDGLCDRWDPDCRTERRLWEGVNACCRLGPDDPLRPEVFYNTQSCSDGIDNDGDSICDFAEDSCRAPASITDALDRLTPETPVSPGQPYRSPWF